MLSRIFPTQLDNQYRGYKIALWILGLIALLRGVMSFNVVFNGHKTAITADGIPLDSYSASAAQTIVGMFALLGLSYFFAMLFCALALIRYRSMVPLVFLWLLLEHLTKRASLYVNPIIRVGTPPGVYVNFALVGLMIVGLVLSVMHRKSGI